MTDESYRIVGICRMFVRILISEPDEMCLIGDTWLIDGTGPIVVTYLILWKILVLEILMVDEIIWIGGTCQIVAADQNRMILADLACQREKTADLLLHLSSKFFVLIPVLLCV